MSGFIAVGYFLVTLFFGLVIYALWLRIALRYLRISSLNVFNKLISTLTNPLVQPIHFLLKYHYQARQKYDWVAFTIIIFIEFIKIFVIGLLLYHTTLPLLLVLIYVLADLIIQPCNVLFYAILIRALMSYVNPNWYHPAADFLRILTEPLLIIGRKIVPDISGFDFSPIIIMIILKVITLFINAYLPFNLF